MLAALLTVYHIKGGTLHTTMPIVLQGIHYPSIRCCLLGFQLSSKFLPCLSDADILVEAAMAPFLYFLHVCRTSTTQMLTKNATGLSHNRRHRVFAGVNTRKEILKGSYIWLYLEIILVALRIEFWNRGWENDVMDWGGKGNTRSKEAFGAFGWTTGLTATLFIKIGMDQIERGWRVLLSQSFTLGRCLDSYLEMSPREIDHESLEFREEKVTLRH